MTENIVGGCALLSLFLPCNSASRNRLRPRNFLRLIQQRIHPFEESHCMRQSRMHLKRHLIHPPRMNEKQPPVPRPPGTCENSGSPPPPRRPCHVAQGILHRTLFPLTRMQPHKSVLLHSHLHPSIFPTARVEQPDLAPAKSTTTAPKDKS